MTVTFKYIDNIDLYWGIAEKFLKKAIRRSGNYTDIQDVYNTCKCGKLSLFIIVSNTRYIGAFCLSITANSKSRILKVEMLGGKGMLSWLEPLLTFLKAIAKDTNCDHITITGRKGWQRLLKEYSCHSINLIHKVA